MPNFLVEHLSEKFERNKTTFPILHRRKLVFLQVIRDPNIPQIIMFIDVTSNPKKNKKETNTLGNPMAKSSSSSNHDQSCSISVAYLPKLNSSFQNVLPIKLTK